MVSAFTLFIALEFSGDGVCGGCAFILKITDEVCVSTTSEKHLGETRKVLFCCFSNQYGDYDC